MSIYRDNLVWIEGNHMKPHWGTATKAQLEGKREWWRWSAGARFSARTILK